MADTLSTLQSKIASLVDQSITAPTENGGEWNVRKTFINRAIKEWSEAYDWEALRTVWQLSTSGVSGATLSLPSDFKKMAGYPVYYNGSTSTGSEWPEIKPNETRLHNSTDDYYYVLGNPGKGFYAIWNPATLASGASIVIQYYKEPTELSATTDTTECPNPEFIIDRAIAYILEARSDARFQEMEGKAREKLLQMVDNENAKSVAYMNDIKTPERLYYGFRLGRD
jgi:hypothetical protein